MPFNSTNIGRPAGAGFTGEKLVGNLDFFTVTVLTDATNSLYMPFASTGVVASRAELVEAGELSDPTLSATNSVVILHPAGAFDDRATASTTYTGNGAYDLAFAQQRNYDLLIQAIGLKAQPVLMGLVASATSADGDDIVDNGGASNGDTVSVFKFAIEHTAVLADNTVATDPKAETLGFLLDSVGDALRAVVSSDDNPFGAGGAYNTWDLATADNKNFSVAFVGTL